MIKYSCLDSIMDASNHFKNGASTKSQTSRENKDDELKINLFVMKNVFLLFCLCLFTSNFVSVYGQSEVGNVKYRQHTGFYLSLSVGPAFGTISNQIKGGDLEKYSGTGALFDIKIGGALQENLILHATMISTSINGAKVTLPNASGRLDDNMSINENMLIGGGLTYYVMPQNILLSGSVGIGNYNFTDTKNSDNNRKTDNGFSMQLKIGKEWWVGKRWGLGMALTYGKTFLNNGPYDGIENKFNSNRFGVLFNATFN